MSNTLSNPPLSCFYALLEGFFWEAPVLTTIWMAKKQLTLSAKSFSFLFFFNLIVSFGRCIDLY